MPSKSGRGRHSARSRKKKGGHGFQPIATQQQAAAQTHRSVSQPEVSAPPTSAPIPMTTPAAMRHPYVAAELRRIGILAGVMLVILIVLALTLS